MKLTDDDILYISTIIGIENKLYYKNVTATRQLCELMDKVIDYDFTHPDDYIGIFNAHVYTDLRWSELVNGEACCKDGWSEKECLEEMNEHIFMLPCGWYVQILGISCKQNKKGADAKWK